MDAKLSIQPSHFEIAGDQTIDTSRNYQLFITFTGEEFAAFYRVLYDRQYASVKVLLDQLKSYVAAQLHVCKSGT